MDIDSILNKLPVKERKLISALIEKDPLTGVYNRRKFFQDIESFASMSERHPNGCGLLVIDVDCFKNINDKKGHLEGDRILQDLVVAIQSVIRIYDKSHIYRYGGDEFIVIMPCTTLIDTINIGERILIEVKKSCGVSVSIGASHCDLMTESVAELLHDADQALCKAKKCGRDKVMTFFNPGRKDAGSLS